MVFARRLTAVLAALCLLVPLGMLAAEAAASKKKTSKKKTTASRKPTATKKKTASTAKKGSTSSKKRATASRRGKKGSRSTTWRNRQTLPTPERYKEIQEALAAKGYLPKEAATGEWNGGSIDALKRFQTEQNLQPTGKIDSLSLIALGLGPKRDQTASAAPPKPPVP